MGQGGPREGTNSVGHHRPHLILSRLTRSLKFDFVDSRRIGQTLRGKTTKVASV